MAEDTAHSAVVIGSHGQVPFQYGDVARISKVAPIRKSILAMLYGKYVANGTIDLDIRGQVGCQVGPDKPLPCSPVSSGPKGRGFESHLRGLFR
jgi:hypothetical protein